MEHKKLEKIAKEQLRDGITNDNDKINLENGSQGGSNQSDSEI